MPSPKPDLRALERDNPNMRERFTVTRDRRNARQAIAAIPPNLLASICEAFDENRRTPHGIMIQKTIDAEFARRTKSRLLLD